MTLEHYDFIPGHSSFSYEFISVGPKGYIRKAVQFTLIYDENIYNLAFGDVNPATGYIDDFAISDNMAERNGIWGNYKKGNSYDAFLVQKKM